MKKIASILIILIAIVPGLVQVFNSSYVVVHPGERAVKVAWGEIKDTTYGPGHVWTLGCTESLGNNVYIVDVKPQKYSYSLRVRTKDLQKITLNVSVLCEPNGNRVHKVIDKYKNYNEYEQKIIRDLVKTTMLSLSGMTDIWSFVGKYDQITLDAVNYIINDQLIAENVVSVKAIRILDYKASKEFEDFIEKTVQTQQGLKLEEYKAQKAAVETQRVMEEAKQAYERLAAIAKANGVELEIKSKTLKNPYISQYEVAKALQKWNGNISLPQTLTLMETANSGMPLAPLLPMMKIGK